MDIGFYIAAAVAVVATVMAISRANAIHALLYLIVSFFAVAVTFYILGAPLVAALEVIVYAGAIMVLFIFTVMFLNLGKAAEEQERVWTNPGSWIGPGILAVILFVETLFVAIRTHPVNEAIRVVAPKEVSISLFTTYILGVEMASMLLLAGLIGAYTIGVRSADSDIPRKKETRKDVGEETGHATEEKEEEQWHSSQVKV